MVWGCGSAGVCIAPMRAQFHPQHHINQTCKASIAGVEAGGQEFQDPPGLRRELKTSPGNVTLPQKTKQNKIKNTIDALI